MHRVALHRSVRTIASALRACAGFAFVACTLQSQPAAQERLAISEGEPVSGAWPMVVWLDNGCTGVLVEPDLVLYAAHCGDAVVNVWTGDAVDVTVAPSSNAIVVSGSTNGAGHPVSLCRTNPNYQPLAGNDIAFCVLEQTVDEVDTFVRPVPACAASEVSVGTTVTIVGFGYDGTGADLGVKRSAVTEVVSLDREIRIGDEVRGTCAGDSGSPAFIQIHGEWTLVGVLSTGVQGEECGTGYYTRMDAVVSWVEAESGRALGWCSERNSVAAPLCLAPALDDEGMADASRARVSELCRAALSTRREPGCSLARRGGRGHVGLMVVAIVIALWTNRRRLRRNRNPAHRKSDHSRPFSAGHPSKERKVLRVNALVGLGSEDEARRAAARFDRAFPRSVHPLRSTR